MNNDNRGVAGTMAILAILLVAAVGFAGYTVFVQDDSDVTDTGDSSSVQKSQANDQPIESSDDVEAELKEIEDVNLDSELDTSGLESDLDAF